MQNKKKLAIITSHPIQYNAPLFRKLAAHTEIEVKVFYTWDKGAGEKMDPGFGKKIDWDIPLLDGYNYTFVKNTAKKAGSHHYKGIQNPTLIDEIKTFQPDAILVYGWNFHSHLKVMRYFHGKVPLWFRGDSTLLDYDYRSLSYVIDGLKTKRPSQYFLLITQYLKFVLRRLFLTWVYSYVDKAFYVGANNESYYLAHGLKEHQLVWMPHAVDNEFFQRDKETVETEAKVWRAALGIKEDDFVVLFAGKFEPKKNPELLVRAVIKMNEQDKGQKPATCNLQPATSPNTHLILVGSGILEAKLKAMAQGKDFIHFLPFQNQSQMPTVYRLGDVFCLPSQGPGETWGLAVNEAMASNRPAIVSNKVGCATDLLSNDNTGFIFQYNSITDLMDKLNNMRKTTNHKKMGDTCNNYIQHWNLKPTVLIDQLNITNLQES